MFLITAPFFAEGKDLLRRTWLGKICGQHFDFDGMQGAQLSAQFREPLLPSRRQYEMRAPGRQFLRECPTDAGTRAGHQRPFATPGIEVRHHA